MTIAHQFCVCEMVSRKGRDWNTNKMSTKQEWRNVYFLICEEIWIKTHTHTHTHTHRRTICMLATNSNPTEWIVDERLKDTQFFVHLGLNQINSSYVDIEDIHRCIHSRWYYHHVARQQRATINCRFSRTEILVEYSTVHSSTMNS